MKKYNTRPIDFTGCHQVIAEHLKRGEEIECWVWDGDRVNTQMTDFITSYISTRDFRYRTAGSFYKNAEPIPLKTRRIMPPERAIPTLMAEGWEFDVHGNLTCPGEKIPAFAFKHFGRPLGDIQNDSLFWPPCIIEEVEVSDESER